MTSLPQKTRDNTKEIEEQKRRLRASAERVQKTLKETRDAFRKN